MAARKPTAAQRELHLKEAYQRVFVTGSASRDDGELVLTDLAAYSGFFATVPDDVSSDVLRVREGRRDLFFHVWRNLRMTDRERMALETAVRSEVLGEHQEEF